MFWIFYAVPALLLNIPYIQQKVATITSTELSEKLHVPVKIGNVQLAWFNNLVLKDLYMEDQQGNILFEASHVSAGFDALPLLKGKIVFSSVRLFGFNLNLAKENPQAPLNLQFIIDAFASKNPVKKEKKNIDLRFNSILIRRGTFTYTVRSQKETPGKFNPNHILIDNLSAKISLKAFRKDSINAYIKKMSFDEQSGFSLNKLSLNVVANQDSAFINNFEIRLPHTNLKLQKAQINFAEVDSFAHIKDHAPIKLAIAPSSICLKDLQAFVPAFKNFSDTIELSANAAGYVNNIDLHSLTLRYSNKMEFNGKMELKGITRPEETYLFGQVGKMYITTDGIEGILNNFSNKPVTLPKEVIKLGTLNFTGEISGFFDNLVAFGTFSSAIGSVKTDLIFGHNKEQNIGAYIKGHLATSGLALDKLFSGNTPVGKASFNISLDAQRPVNGTFSGKVDARIQELDLMKYKYENIQLSGKFKKNGFDGRLNIDDPNGKVDILGMFKHEGKNSIFNFTARLNHIKLDTLNLTKKYESPDLSLSLNADFTGNNIDNLEGSIILDSLSFQTVPRDFFLKQLKIEATGHSLDRHLSVTSDIINGEITGAYSFQTIVPSLLNTFKGYLPALVKANEKKATIRENNFSLLFTIENTEAASEAFKLPFTIVNQARLIGHYNNSYNKFRFEAFLPMFKSGKTSFESGYLLCNNPADKVNLEVRATNFNTKGLRNYLDIKADAKEDCINTLLTWANNKERLFKADLATTTTFTIRKDEKSPAYLRTEIALSPSAATFNDSTWMIHPAKVGIEKGKISIRDFYANHNEQFVKIDGDISKEPSDTLLLELKDLELSYVFDILNIPVLQFGGRATGTFNLTDLSGSRIVNTDLSILDFSFNQIVFGKLNLYSEWDDAQKGILMLGSIYKNDSTWTDINGYIHPIGPNAGLSLYFDANDLNVAFIQPFMANIANNVQGRGFGQVHLFGPFKALNIEGDVFVKDGGLGIDYLNTYYTFSDSIHLTPSSIYMKDITIHDPYGNQAKVNGTVNHTHFKNMNFQTHITASNMLVYNATENLNPLIYGKVYASGTTSIKGNSRLIDFNINLRNSPNTAITLNFMDGSKATDYDFITFVNKKQSHTEKNDSIPSVENKKEENSGGAELRMNFQLDMTPDADITMIIDAGSGDKIRGNGSGSLQIQYGNRSDLRIYGNYTIVNGVYNFSLQKVIHKNFKIREGSALSFHGDPFSATMNIDAIYNLTANLTDLDESLMTESSRTNVPVNCVLKLDGVIRNPAISFDIELPNSSQEIERQVKSIINTEDMMTRQIVYLLVLNKFYTPEYANISGGTSNFAAVASSTISSQLSSILSSITDKVQIGTNIRTNNTSFSDTEVELLLSSQLLNNRLLFNGNFGYKDSQQLNASFVGEFDLEYKLNKSGEIRLKAYNHYNDLHRYYDKSVPTTQGVGIMFKKDFIRPSDIFKKKKKMNYTLPPARSDSIPAPAKQE